MTKLATPLCITVDFETPDDNSVTIRDRDTMRQKRIEIRTLKIFGGLDNKLDKSLYLVNL